MNDDDQIHIEPVNDLYEHKTSPDCPCSPVFKEGLWVHRSWDGRELDEEGHEITLPARVAERMILFCYWMGWVSSGHARETLGITQETLNRRFKKFLEELDQNELSAEEFKAAALLLQNSAT